MQADFDYVLDPYPLIWASMSVYHILHTLIAFQVQHLAADELFYFENLTSTQEKEFFF